MSFDWKNVSLTAAAVPLLAVAMVAASLPTQKTTPKEPGKRASGRGCPIAVASLPQHGSRPCGRSAHRRANRPVP